MQVEVMYLQSLLGPGSFTHVQYHFVRFLCSFCSFTPAPLVRLPFSILVLPVL